jgi:hypothetical protein
MALDLPALGSQIDDRAANYQHKVGGDSQSARSAKKNVDFAGCWLRDFDVLGFL